MFFFNFVKFYYSLHYSSGDVIFLKSPIFTTFFYIYIYQNLSILFRKKNYFLTEKMSAVAENFFYSIEKIISVQEKPDGSIKVLVQWTPSEVDCKFFLLFCIFIYFNY